MPPKAQPVRLQTIMVMNTQPQQSHQSHSPSRLRRAFVAAAALMCTFFAAPIYAASADKPSTPTPERAQLTIKMEDALKPWTGDLDGMIERRSIRVLTVYSKTLYYVDKGAPHGAIFEVFRLFEDDLNKKLAKERKQKHLKVRMHFVPFGRNEMLQALAAGKGDIAVGQLTITPERQKLVDFASPTYPNVSEVVVSGSASPAVSQKQRRWKIVL